MKTNFDGKNMVLSNSIFGIFEIKTHQNSALPLDLKHFDFKIEVLILFPHFYEVDAE